MGALGHEAPAEGGGNRPESRGDGVRTLALDREKNRADSNETILNVDETEEGGVDGKENNSDSQIDVLDCSIQHVIMCDENSGKPVSNDGHGDTRIQTKPCLKGGQEVKRLRDNATINDFSSLNRKDSSPLRLSPLQFKAGSKRNVFEEDAVTNSCLNNFNSKKRKYEDELHVVSSSKLGVSSEIKTEQATSRNAQNVILPSSALSQWNSSSNNNTTIASERNTAVNDIQSKFIPLTKSASKCNSHGSDDSAIVIVASEAMAEAATSSTAPVANDLTSSSHHTHKLEMDHHLTKSIQSSNTNDHGIKQDGNEASSSEVEILPSLPSKPPKPTSRKSVESTSSLHLNNAESSALSLQRVNKEAAPRQGKPKPKPKSPNRNNDVIEIDCSSTSSTSSSDFIWNRPARKHPNKSDNRRSKKKSGEAGKIHKSKNSDTSSRLAISNAATEANARREKATIPLKQKNVSNYQTSKPSERKKLCFACSSCKCHSRDGTSATPKKHTPLATLSGSHARQEQALINRLQRIERNVQWMESQKADVGRQLIKHRNAMTNWWEEQNPKSSTDRPKFLADVDDWDCVEQSRVMEAKEVGRVIAWTFGKEKCRSSDHCVCIYFPID